MGYYKEKQKALRQLEAILKKFTGKKTISKTALIYTLENSFEVGELAILKRLNRLEELGFIEIKGNYIKWIKTRD